MGENTIDKYGLPLVAHHVYNNGDYDHALKCYFAAKEWAIDTGACWKDGLHGVINRPHHELCPSSCRIVPPELINQGGWNVTVDFFCDDAAREWLLRQAICPLASLIVVANGLIAASAGVKEH